jgi:hypothetical protein
MRRAWRVAELLVPPTIGLGVALVLARDRAELEVHVWLLVVLALVVLAFLSAVRSAYPTTPSPFATSLRQPRPARERPGALVRLEREVSMAGSAAFDVHYRLRPALVELAAGLLSSRRGIDLQREPGRAQAVLGDDVWELVRPDRPQPLDHLGAGIDGAHLDRVVSALEQV